MKQIREYLDANPEASRELSDAHIAVMKAYKATYTTEEFRQILASGANIDSNLEEAITSAALLLNQERMRGQ